MMEEVNPIQSSKWRMHDTFMHEMGSGRERRPFSVESRPSYPEAFKGQNKAGHGFDFGSER